MFIHYNYNYVIVAIFCICFRLEIIAYLYCEREENASAITLVKESVRKFGYVYRIKNNRASG